MTSSVQVEDGHRKLRHLFVVENTISCAKLVRVADKTEFQVKWTKLLDEVKYQDNGYLDNG